MPGYGRQALRLMLSRCPMTVSMDEYSRSTLRNNLRLASQMSFCLEEEEAGLQALGAPCFEGLLLAHGPGNAGRDAIVYGRQFLNYLQSEGRVLAEFPDEENKRPIERAHRHSVVSCLRRALTDRSDTSLRGARTSDRLLPKVVGSTRAADCPGRERFHPVSFPARHCFPGEAPRHCSERFPALRVREWQDLRRPFRAVLPVIGWRM